MAFGSRSSHEQPFGSFGGTTMSAFGGFFSSGASGFEQSPNVGAFWSNPAQRRPFGSMTQPSQPAFGSTVFATSVPFGGSQSAFGTNSTPPFGATSSQAFGSTRTSAFGASGTPEFGATSSQAFGSTRSSAFGGTGTAFGASSTPAFGSSSAKLFHPGAGFENAAPFGFPYTTAFGQSNSTFGSIPFCASSPLVQNFGAQATMCGNTGFWNSTFGDKRGGSRVAKYTESLERDTYGATTVKFMPISAMPAYIDKSHEELHLEDYQLGDKGGLAPSSGSGFGISNTQSGIPASVTTQTSTWPFKTSISSSIFGPKTPPLTSTCFGVSSSPFRLSCSPCGSSNTTHPSSFPSVFCQISPPSLLTNPATSSFTFPAPSSNSTSSFIPTVSNAQTGVAFGQASTSFWPTQTPFGQTNMFSTPSTGFSTPTNLFAPSYSSSSVFGQTSSPLCSQTTSAPASTSTSTFNSGLHSFTLSIPQTGGTFGQTSTFFGHNVYNHPFTGFGSGSTSAAIPTSNSIGFSQPAFLGKDLDKDVDMDEWVFC